MRNVKINLYEVGDIFLTLNNINPGTRFKGTWELIAKGRTLVGVDPDDTDFDVVEKTGGSKDIQAHIHPQLGINANPSKNSNVRFNIQNDGNMVLYQTNGGVLWASNTRSTGSTYRSTTLGPDGETGSTGNGNSGNLQPYLTCYIWCRTA